VALVDGESGFLLRWDGSTKIWLANWVDGEI
jgi:hypothetical protein